MSVSEALPAAQAPAAVKAPASSAMPAPKPIAVVAPEPLRIDPVKMEMQIKDTVALLNSQMEKNKFGLGFSVDHVANKNVVTVRDSSTGEIIRQLPSEAVLKVAHSIESLKGLIYDHNV